MKKKLLTAALLLTLTLPIAAQSDGGSKVPDFSNTPRAEVPEEFTWNVADIYPDMKAWNAARDATIAKFSKVEEMAQTWTDSAANMLAFFQLNDDLMMNAYKLFSYASPQSHMDMADNSYRLMLGQLSYHFQQFQAKMSFINDDILALGEEAFDAYIEEEPGLKQYEFGVRDVFRRKDHILKSDQQRIVTLAGMYGSAASQASQALNNTDIPNPTVTLSDGKEYTLNYPTFSRLRATKNPEDRQLVMDTFFENIKKYENTFAILLDGQMKQHLFSAQVRNYDNTLVAVLDNNNIDPKVYENVMNLVKANTGPLHRYLELKKELLGLDTLKYVDMYASSVASIDKEYTWDEAEEIVLTASAPLGEEYLKMLKAAFSERWIDRYPNKNKQSGAYSSGVYGVHPYIKMNYTGDFNNVSTLAHELGHAMHSYFSQKTQPFNLSNYPTFLAEIASTFNEHLLIDYLVKNEEDDLLKLYILDNYITGMRGTIYRQALFADFERKMHERVESGQTLTADWLNKTYLDLTREYYGHEEGITQVDQYIESEWAVIPHFYYNYYVYAYTTGMIASLALSEVVANGGPEEVAGYIEFLSAGGSDYPLETLKKAGVDMTTAEPFEAAFRRLDAIVTEMEEIVARLKADGKLGE